MSGFSLEAFNASQDEYLGATCWWMVHSGSWTLGHVRDLMESNGFDPNSIKDPTPRKAFSRAAKNMESGREGRFSRGISDDPTKRVVGVVQEFKDEAEESLDYAQTTTARLHKQDGTIEVEGELATEFRSQYDHYAVSVTDDDIRLLIRHVIAQVGGVPLRATGGVYFIPRDAVETLDRLNTVLDLLSAGKVYLMRVPDSGDKSERAIAWECAESELTGRLETIENAVGRIDKRAKSLAKHQDRLAEVERIMGIYIGLCEEEAKAESIRERIKAAGDRVAEKMGELENVTDAAREKVKADRKAKRDAAKSTPEAVLARAEQKAAKKVEKVNEKKVEKVNEKKAELDAAEEALRTVDHDDADALKEARKNATRARAAHKRAVKVSAEAQDELKAAQAAVSGESDVEPEPEADAPAPRKAETLAEREARLIAEMEAEAAADETADATA